MHSLRPALAVVLAAAERVVCLLHDTPTLIDLMQPLL